MSASFSRKQETAADDYGYDFLKSAGKNPWAMAMAFEELQRLSSGETASGNTGRLRIFGRSVVLNPPGHGGQNLQDGGKSRQGRLQETFQIVSVKSCSRPR